MEIAPLDLTALAGTVLGMMVVLIPVFGFTLRFALKPIVETYSRAKSPQLAEVHQLHARVALLEQQIAELRSAGLEVPVSSPMQDLVLPGVTPVRAGV
jgi:hypothetical protein